MTSGESAAPEDLELFLNEEFWAHGAAARADVFRRLRDDAPVCFMEEPEIPNFETGPGFWSVTRHEDLMHVSRHPDLFCSGRGTNIPDLPIEIAEFMGSMINMDAPLHTRLHFCLGANLARREIGVMFAELFRWLPDIRTTSEPAHLQSSFIHGIKRMRCEFTPTTVDPLED